MSDTADTPTDQVPQAATKEAWKRNRDHLITLPSGTQIKVRLPNLPNLIKGGQVPNPLMKVAIQIATTGSTQGIDEELIAELPDFHRYLVHITAVEPEIALDEVDDIPYEDTELLVALACRETDLDAVGHQLAGLEKIDSYRRFRGLPDVDQSVEGV